MFNVIDMCARRGLRIPDPRIDARGRKIYRIEANGEQIYAVTNELVLGGCKPRIKTCYYSPSTVEVTESRRSEAWIFRFYASNDRQAENTIWELLNITDKNHEYQEMLDL